MSLREDALNHPFESKSLGTLLLNLLDYYADKFPYTTSVISVTSRSILSKAEMGWEKRDQPQSLSIQCLVRPGASLDVFSIVVTHTHTLWSR